jgi:hypothetical protein
MAQVTQHFLLENHYLYPIETSRKNKAKQAGSWKFQLSQHQE